MKKRPFLGDELYPLFLANTVKAGHLINREAEQQLAWHKTVELALANEDGLSRFLREEGA